MTAEESQLELYKHFFSFVLPEGMLDFFDLVWIDRESVPDKINDIVYTGILKMHLDERDNRPEEMSDLRPNGFTEVTVVNDFPVRDCKLELHIRRRRWLTPEGRNVVLNVYPLAVTGTRYSAEFAAFLKDKLGYDPRYGPFAGAFLHDGR